MKSVTPLPLILAFAITIGAGLNAFAQQVTDQVAPEVSSGQVQKTMATAKNWMVVAANPYATNAGHQIIKTGGNAVDAMVAIQLVLGLVEPQSSGIGGGAFALFWDNQGKQLLTFDGRETAPSIVDGNLFLGKDKKTMRFFQAVVGGRSVGVPGTIKLLETMHKQFGKLPWKQVVQPAIDLAKKGFIVSPRLNKLIRASAQSLYQDPMARGYFFSEEGVPIYAGTRLKNLPYAKILQAIALQGSKAFYNGDNAKAIVQAVRNHPTNPGFISLKDLARYKVNQRKPVCIPYRGYKVCGMGPPSSGGLTIGQILKMVEPYDLAKLGPNHTQSWQIIGDASSLAFADRGRYMADSDFVAMPKGLLNENYLRERSNLIDPKHRPFGKALRKGEIRPGDPPFDHASNWADSADLELPSTSHFSIVDQQGNVLSMTTTIENGFGSRTMVNGYLLNNELTDFSFLPTINGKPVANSVQGGKRPRSSMAPTIIFKDNRPWAALGSPGGSRIIGYVAKTIIALIDWSMNIQAAVELPHRVNRFGTFDIEKGPGANLFANLLQNLGYKTKIRELNSGLHGIVMENGYYYGGVDPRREGLALGQ